MVEYVLLIHLDRALDYLTGNFEKFHARNMMVPQSQNFKRSFSNPKWFCYYKRKKVDYQS